MPGCAAGAGARDALPVRRLAFGSRRFLGLRAVKVTAGGDCAGPRDAGGTATARRVAPRAGVCAIQRRHGEARPGSDQGCSRAGLAAVSPRALSRGSVAPPGEPSSSPESGRKVAPPAWV